MRLNPTLFHMGREKKIVLAPVNIHVTFHLSGAVQNLWAHSQIVHSTLRVRLQFSSPLHWPKPFSQAHHSPWFQGSLQFPFNMSIWISQYIKSNISKLNSIFTHKPKLHPLRESLIWLSKSVFFISSFLTLLIQLTLVQGSLEFICSSPLLCQYRIFSCRPLFVATSFWLAFSTAVSPLLNLCSRLLPIMYF